MKAGLALATSLSALAAGATLAEPLSITGEHDIGVLLDRAAEARNLGDEDAVLLLDELREDWTADGRRVHSVHRIVYVRTGYGVRHHADLRVPYDGARQDFAVRALRTWRPSDERWIESGPTARVETLPFALDHAPDYQQRREMMLLHDGVELPCVLETAYSIEDKSPYRGGVSGLWTVRREEPAVISRLVLRFAPGTAPSWVAPDGAPEPVRGRDTKLGLETLVFEAGPVDPLPYPRLAGAMDAVPRVVWSTWRDWSSLGGDLRDRFEAAVGIDDGLQTRFAERMKAARADSEKLQLVAEFVADSTRWVDYGIGWWPAPRTAARTWVTAYGDRIDRAALGATLYRAAGWTAELVFVGRPLADAERRVPTLEWTDGPGVWVQGEEFQGYFDPSDASFTRGVARLTGQTMWQPLVDREPSVPYPMDDARSKIDLVLDLHFDEEAEAWKGTGVLNATDALCPFDRMAGLGNQSHEYLGELASSVLRGAEVTEHNPATFHRSRVTVGFGIEVPVGEPDALGRIRLEVADPGEVSALLSQAAIHLHDEARGSAVDLPTAIERRVELRLDPGEGQVVIVPQPRTLDNRAGRFEVTADEEDGKLRLTRQLVVSKSHYPPEEWPDLRAVLLADHHEGGRLVLLRPTE